MHAKSAKMTVLSIETSTRVCSAALSVDGQTIASRMNREDSNHARFLSIFVNELLDELNAQSLSLDAVALSEGPGRYTGLRIPLIPIATTEVLCASLMAKEELQDGDYLLPMIDARRMEVYTALYQLQNGQFVLENDIAAKVIDSAEALAYGNGRNVFFGDGAAKCKDILSQNADFIDAIVPDAADMGLLALRHLQDKRTCRTATDLAYYEPFYLKEFIAAQSHVKGLV